MIAQTQRLLVTREREKQEKKEWLKKVHVFQRYMELRQERALSNWQRHSVEWNRIEQTISKQINRNASESLMVKIAEYRLLVEESEFLEEALRLIEKSELDFWRSGLRIGSELLGLTFPMPKGGPREYLY
jgi:hypothetical protein